MEKDWTISKIRMIAMLLIIITHILGFYECALTYWTNIGVQIFFVISGLLYGTKIISGSKPAWIKKRAIKLLKSFYIYVIVVFAVYYFAAPEYLSVKKVIGYLLCLQAFFGSIEGIEQLWFVTYILICYVMTPYFFAPVTNRINGGGYIRFWGTIISLSLIAQIITIPIALKLNFKVAWIITYWLGYAISVRYKILEKNHRAGKEERAVFKIVVFAFAAAVLMRIGIDLSGLQNGTGIITEVIDLIVQYLKIIMGVGITWILYVCFNKLKEPRKEIKRILNFSDSCSYEIYIVHQMFVLSEMAILLNGGLIQIICSIVLALICIFISAVILKFVSVKLIKL